MSINMNESNSDDLFALEKWVYFRLNIRDYILILKRL